MPDPIPAEAALLAEIEALRAELATQQRAVPPLPAEHDRRAITWRPWSAAPEILSHIDMACEQCAHPGPPMQSFGLVGDPPLIQYYASRCPACQEMRVSCMESPRYGVPRTKLREVAYHPPRLEPNDA